MTRRQTLLGAAAAAVAMSMQSQRGQAEGQSARSAGFWYPEETEPHERTFMQWPVNPAVYDDPDFLDDIQKTIAKIANTIAEFEPVVMLAAAQHHRAVRKLVSRNVELWDIPTDDLWCRDSGPSFVVDGKGGLAVTQFNFNGWGNKQTHGADGQIAARIAERMGVQVFDTGLVGEAGGVETDAPSAR